MNCMEIKKQLSVQLSEKRYSHSLGVSQTAVKLAKRYGYDTNKAKIAGLLHDCARELPMEVLLSKAEEFGIVVDDVEKQEPILLHAPVAAQMAKIWYGIQEQDILQAIALHTTGNGSMTLLDKIVYLADMIEPQRKFKGVEELRLLAEKDVDEAFAASLDQSIRHILKGGGLIHPGTIDARNQLIIARRRGKKE